MGCEVLGSRFQVAGFRSATTGWAVKFQVPGFNLQVSGLLPGLWLWRLQIAGPCASATEFVAGTGPVGICRVVGRISSVPGTV